MSEAPARGAVVQRHVILISTASPTACLEAVSSVLGRVGADIGAFSLKPVALRFEAVLRLKGVDVTVADRAASMIAAWPDAGAVRVEHQWVRS